MSRPRTTPLARDDSPAALMAAGVPAFEDEHEDEHDGAPGAARVTPRHGGRGAHRGRAPRTPLHEHPAEQPARVVKHRPAAATGRQVEPQCLPQEPAAWPALATPPLPVLDLRRARATASPTVTVTATALARPLEPGLGVAELLARLPGGHAAQELRAAADAIVRARLAGRGVVLGMGALPVERGLSPLVIDLIERRVITAVALDGAGVLHDLALAARGADAAADRRRPAAASKRPTAARESGALLERIVREAAASEAGLGAAVGRHVSASRMPGRRLSIAAACARAGIPVTTHVALGPGLGELPPLDAATVGAVALRDFHHFTAVVAGLAHGVYVQLGASALLPALLPAAFDRARAAGHAARPLTTIALGAGTVAPPAGSRARILTGEPELLFPLLGAAVLEQLAAAHRPERPRRR